MDYAEEPPLSHQVRNLMRSLPSSVVVLTATTLSTTPPVRRYRGVTLSSFTTLTLTPDPIVTFNIRSPSRTLDAITKSRHFLIHILDASLDGVQVADVFTKAGYGIGGRDVFREGEEAGIFAVKKEVAGVGKMKALPRLEGKGIRRVLRCEVLTEDTQKQDQLRESDWAPSQGLVRVGDHVLVMGIVREILDVDEAAAGEGAFGLSYVDGKYRMAGEAIRLARKDNEE